MADVEKLSDRLWLAVFSFLSVEELGRCSSVCRRWEKIIRNDQDGVLWKPLYLRVVPAEGKKSASARACLKDSYRALLRSWYYRWGSHSHNMHTNGDPYLMYRKPVAQSSDAARTVRGFSSGQHSWKVKWPSNPGSEAVLGVATESAKLQCEGYKPLLGSDCNGWGWHLGKNKLIHDGEFRGDYPCRGTHGTKLGGFKPSSNWITVTLDMDHGILSFERGDTFLGVAFDRMPTSEPLYPCISAVYGNSEISLVYIGPPLLG